MDSLRCLPAQPSRLRATGWAPAPAAHAGRLLAAVVAAVHWKAAPAGSHRAHHARDCSPGAAAVAGESGCCLHTCSFSHCMPVACCTSEVAPAAHPEGLMLMKGCFLVACSFPQHISGLSCISDITAAVQLEGCTVRWWPCTACNLSARRPPCAHALQAAAVDRGQQRTKAACCLALMRNRALGQAFRSWAAYAAHVKVGPQQANFHIHAVL